MIVIEPKLLARMSSRARCQFSDADSCITMTANDTSFLLRLDVDFGDHESLYAIVPLRADELVRCAPDKAKALVWETFAKALGLIIKESGRKEVV